MSGDPRLVGLDPVDFGLEPSDPLVELLDRQRVEVLLAELDDRLAGLEVVLLVHATSVDRGPSAVNNAPVVIPSSMRAIAISSPGGPDSLVVVERPVPAPGGGEVLIQVAAAGVNRPDVLQRMGLYPPPPGAPDTPGLEVAGTVVAAGEGAGQLMGQRVCALIAGGGYAQYCVAPVGTCLPVPEVLRLSEAAAMPETLFTVWINLFERGFAADGDTVLVHGGTSGIGTMAIKLGSLFGLTVIVTCGSDEKCDAALKMGALHAINYNSEDFVAAVREFTGGRGVSVVLDMVGGDYLPRNLACLADDGRHVSIAFQRGATAELPIPEVMRRRLILTGSTLRPRDLAFKTMVADEIARTVWPYVEGNRLKPVIDSTFPLDQAADAHRRMESGEHIGKIVLEVD